jgi:SAM-dependent methyltransferase
VDERYGLVYRDLYRRHWWWRARERFLVGELRRLRPAPGWPRILDVGCGDGLFFGALREFGTVEGLESDAALLSPDNPDRSQICIGTLDSTYRPVHPFDLILLLDVVEHLRDPLGALRRAREILNPGGTILITVPAFRTLWTRHDALNHHFTRYTKASVADLARAAGIPARESRYFFHWLAPVKLAVRAFEALGMGGSAVPGIPPGPVNAAAYSWSRLEQRLTRRMPIPFGSSLLFVGGA